MELRLENLFQGFSLLIAVDSAWVHVLVPLALAVFCGYCWSPMLEFML